MQAVASWLKPEPEVELRGPHAADAEHLPVGRRVQRGIDARVVDGVENVVRGELDGEATVAFQLDIARDLAVQQAAAGTDDHVAARGAERTRQRRRKGGGVEELI